MNTSIQTQREQRAALAKKVNKLVEDDQSWSDESQVEYDKIIAQIDDIDGDIARREKILAVNASAAAPANARASKDGTSVDEAEHNLKTENGIFNAWMRGGDRALNTEQREFLANKAAKINNALSTGVDADGGYLIPEGFSGSLSEALKEYGGMREVAEIIRTAGGNDIPYPTTDATSEIGEILAEGSTAADEDGTFGTKVIGAHMFSSKVITVPMQLLQDSGIDLEAHLLSRLQTRLGRITNAMYTVGTGTGQPEGIVTASASGKVATTGSATTIGINDLLALIHSVDPAYRKSAKCNLMFNDSTLLKLKQLKDTQGRPLWLPGMDIGAPDTLFGESYVINQEMADMAANAKSILFGDFGSYKIRDIMDVQLFRFTDSAYTRKAQVGFMALMRSDGKLTDVGGAVKYFQNSAS